MSWDRAVIGIGSADGDGVMNVRTVIVEVGRGVSWFSKTVEVEAARGINFNFCPAARRSRL